MFMEELKVTKKFSAFALTGFFTRVFLTFFLASSAWSATKTKKMMKLDPVKYAQLLKSLSPAETNGIDYPFYTDAEVTKITDAIESQRSPAAGGDGGVIVSSEFKALAEELVNISAIPRASVTKPDQLTANTDRLDNFLAKLEAHYGEYKEADTKLFASQYIPLRTLRGVVWKMIGLFKARKTHPAHTLALTAFKNFAGQMNIAFPDQDWQVGFDYVTQPYVRDVVDEKGRTHVELAEEFSNLAEFQALIAQYRFKVNEAIKRFKSIDVVSGKPVMWDQKLAFGPVSFKDDIGRYKRVGELEKQTLLSNMFFSVSQMDFMQAYSMNGSLDLSQKLGMMFGLDGAFIAGVEGVTAEQIHNVFTSNSSVGMGLPDRTKEVKQAFKDLKDALTTFNLAWKQTKERGSGGAWLVNAGFSMRDRTYIDTKIQELARALNKKVKIRNSVTGEEAVVDLPAFFNSGGSASLSDMMPKEFTPPLMSDKRDPEWVPVVLTDSKNVKHSSEFRDYEKGGPAKWDRSKFSVVFPEVRSDEDLKRAFRVFHSTFASFSNIDIFTGVQR